jgi:hypothetical protein
MSANLVHFVYLWYILCTFGIFCGFWVHEKSGKPGHKSSDDLSLSTVTVRFKKAYKRV